jgi:hypothetical protein
MARGQHHRFHRPSGHPFRSHSIIPPIFSDPFFDSALGSGIGLAFFGVRLLAWEMASLLRQRSIWSLSSWFEVKGPNVAAQIGQEGPSRWSAFRLTDPRKPGSGRKSVSSIALSSSSSSSCARSMISASAGVGARLLSSFRTFGSPFFEGDGKNCHQRMERCCEGAPTVLIPLSGIVRSLRVDMRIPSSLIRNGSSLFSNSWAISSQLYPASGTYR